MRLGRGRQDGRRTRVRKSRHHPNPRLAAPTFADAANALPCAPGRFAMRPNGGAEIPSRMAIRSQARPCRNQGGKPLAGRTANAPAVRTAARRVAHPKFLPAALQPRAASGQAFQSGCRRQYLRRLHRERAACTSRTRRVCTSRGILAAAARTSRRPSDRPTQGGWQRPWLAAGMRRGTCRRIREDSAARRRAIAGPERHGQAPVDDRNAKLPPCRLRRRPSESGARFPVSAPHRNQDLEPGRAMSDAVPPVDRVRLIVPAGSRPAFRSAAVGLPASGRIRCGSSQRSARETRSWTGQGSPAFPGCLS